VGATDPFGTHFIGKRRFLREPARINPSSDSVTSFKNDYVDPFFSKQIRGVQPGKSGA
jgi:hypothetical protein